MGTVTTTKVILEGEIGASFSSMADRIAEMGATIAQLGGKIYNFGEESVNTYREYETSMLDAKGALSGTYTNATQLERVYAGLEEAAQKWAASSIFHTNDVSKAISEAAHAGWDYNQILEGIPAAMLLAQAGGLSLSQGLDYIIKSTNASGTAFEDLGKFVDEWTMAANTSATNVNELGQAMTAMGATMKFGDSTAEVLTMLGVLADSGTVGSKAGTLLRNAFIRLVAPTKNAREAMEALGVSTEEYEEAMSGVDEDGQAVLEKLEKMGFSAYTTEGKLKPMIQSFHELNDLTKDMSEQERNQILSTIFPLRSITGAMAFLDAISEIDERYNKINEAEGYAANVAKTQLSGLMGAQEIYFSKQEEFKRKTGETIAEPLEEVYGFLGGIYDTLNGFDETTMSTLVGGMAGLAALGPAMMGVGAAMKFISVVGVPGLAAMAGATGLGALVGWATKVHELEVENAFGTMAINMMDVGHAIGDINSNLNTDFSIFTQYRDAAMLAAQEAQEAGEQMLEGLWTKMVTGATLTEDDQKKYIKYGEDISKAIEQGITDATAEKLDFFGMLFGTDNTQAGEGETVTDPAFASIVQLITAGYDEAIATAEAKSAELRAAMTSAFADGVLSEAELENIQSIMGELYNIMDNYIRPSDIEQAKLRNKSTRVSLESMEEYTQEVANARNAMEGEMDAQMEDAAAYLQVMYDWATKNGTKIVNPFTGELSDPSEVSIDDLIDKTYEHFAGVKTEKLSAYDDMLFRGWQNALSTNEMGEAYGQAQEIYKNWSAGMIDMRSAMQQFSELDSRTGLLDGIESMLKYYGGEAAFRRMMNGYRAAGGAENEARADWMDEILFMRGLTTGDIGRYTQDQLDEGAQTAASMRDALQDAYQLWFPHKGDWDFSGVTKAYEELNDQERDNWEQTMTKMRLQYNLSEAANAFGGAGLSAQQKDWLGAYLISNGYVSNPSEYTWSTKDQVFGPVVADTFGSDVASMRAQYRDLQAQISLLQAKRDANDATISNISAGIGIQGLNKGEVEGWLNSLNGQNIQIDADISAAQAALDNLMALAAAMNLNVTGTATYNVDSSRVDSYTPPTKYGTAVYSAQEGGGAGTGASGTGIEQKAASTATISFARFAEGGRATEASIFGEDGAEWAIPEEHSQRTAELLNAAREASGFTWGDLIGRYGGLNGSTSGINVNIASYSPVINAVDARGVADQLIADKERLRRVVMNAVREAMENMALRDAVEVYA